MFKFYIEIDEAELEEKIDAIITQQVEEKIIEDKVLWTVKDLAHQLSIGQTKLRETILLDPRLPKFKIGSNWRFPVKETRLFIDLWVQEQLESHKLRM